MEQSHRNITELYESKEGRSENVLYLIKKSGDETIERQWVQYDNIKIIKELIDRFPKVEGISFSTTQLQKYLKGISKIVSDIRLANMKKWNIELIPQIHIITTQANKNINAINQKNL